MQVAQSAQPAALSAFVSTISHPKPVLAEARGRLWRQACPLLLAALPSGGVPLGSRIAMLQLHGPVAQAAGPAQQPASGSSSGGASGACSRPLRRTWGQQPIPQQQQPRRRLAAPAGRRSLAPAAARKEAGGAGLNRLESPVPREQRPVNELQQLKDTPLLSWATLELPEYAKRLAILYSGVFLLLGGPIAAQTFDPLEQPLEFFLSGSTGSLLVVAAAALRIFLGWKYVGDRLLTASLEYEETGWYDGQVFVKPPEVLTRDRLLGTYEVKPVLARLRTTLQGVAVALAGTAVTLAILINSQLDADGAYGRGSARKLAQVTPTGILYSSDVKSLEDLINDDEAAEREAEAQGGIPGYCGDRYFKAFAGGERVCEKFERRR
ncbi:hypothetical protein ABPG75_002548 [Micractinium tetrahymenae]